MFAPPTEKYKKKIEKKCVHKIIRTNWYSHSILDTSGAGCGEYSDVRTFSDTNIRSYHIRIIFFDTNIFGYSFKSKI